MGETLVACREETWRPLILKIIFVIVIALGLVCCGLMVRYGVFGEDVFEGAEGDVMIPQVVTSYCKEIKVESADKESHFTVYVNSGSPKLSAKRNVYSSGTSFYIPSWSFQFWRLHLLKGTTVDINICADQYIMFYIIKGEKYHTEWSQSTLFDKYHFKHRLLPQKNCIKKSSFQKHQLKAVEDDYYYIMFSSSVGWRFFTRVYTMMMFNRTVYDTTKASYRCHNLNNTNDTCTVPLKYLSDETVSVEYSPAMGKSPNTFRKNKIKWHPVPRPYYYLLFFGGIFCTIFTFTILYSLWRCFAKNIKLKQDKFPLLTVPNRIYSDSTGSRFKVKFRSRQNTRATLGSYEVISRYDFRVDDEEENEDDVQRNLNLNESHNLDTTQLTQEQVQNQCLTATGVSAI